eukprot:gnl/MRDRNA2_/MRDRNA2_30390_c0_seq1.p1 gnl/MRDRNA2_/MRDRNA2_30390_c0~~gnl/MRDRNA2_/MRDRNA2_30390_c0_seq1.p1  ORF type:complete len:192 (-),score=33.21 gnl/MRDRNA2_/MRDRNA2_30390_c0_seq1:2-577(-)
MVVVETDDSYVIYPTTFYESLYNDVNQTVEVWWQRIGGDVEGELNVMWRSRAVKAPPGAVIEQDFFIYRQYQQMQSQVCVEYVRPGADVEFRTTPVPGPAEEEYVSPWVRICIDKESPPNVWPTENVTVSEIIGEGIFPPYKVLTSDCAQLIEMQFCVPGVFAWIGFMLALVGFKYLRVDFRSLQKRLDDI